jgi:hypothetical protein
VSRRRSSNPLTATEVEEIDAPGKRSCFYFQEFLWARIAHSRQKFLNGVGDSSVRPGNAQTFFGEILIFWLGTPRTAYAYAAIDAELCGLSRMDIREDSIGLGTMKTVYDQA